MRDEKPGGHGERPGAVGLLDAAAWDLSAKLADKPLWRLLAFNAAAGLGLGGFPLELDVSDGHASPGEAPGTGFERDAGFAVLFADLVA